MTVRVAVASKYGATAEIAEAIGRGLREGGVATKARGHRLFAGKIDKGKLGFGERALLLALRVPEGDFRDWAEIAAWATMIAGAIGGEESSDVR